MSIVLEEWSIRASRLLLQLSTPYGIKASLSAEANYAAIFTRDAVMAGIVGLLAGDKQIADSFRSTLQHLKELQGKNGQIASNYTIVDGKVSRVSYGALSPKIDAATWYLTGVGLGVRHGLLQAAEWTQSVQQVINLLDSLEYNNRHLIYIAEGGNWADEYVYEGYILYDQLLRFWGLQLAGRIWAEPAWQDKAARIADTIFRNYAPGQPEHPEASGAYHPVAYARRPAQHGTYFYTSFSPGGYNDVFDLAANSLLCLLHPGKPEIRAGLDWINRHFLLENKLPPAFYPIIRPGHPKWDELSNFYLFSFKNQPGHYHNGGIWLIWLGWLALALRINQHHEGLENLARIVESALTQSPDFAFEEYWDGEQSQAGGTRQMAYSATGLLMLRHALLSTDLSTSFTYLL